MKTMVLLIILLLNGLISLATANNVRHLNLTAMANPVHRCCVTRLYKTPGPVVTVSKLRVVQWSI